MSNYFGSRSGLTFCQSWFGPKLFSTVIIRGQKLSLESKESLNFLPIMCLSCSWSFMFLFCLVFAMSLCASVYICFVVTCWERADLLALVCGVFCELVTFPLVSWVRCSTWLYRFLIFAPLLTSTGLNHKCLTILDPDQDWHSVSPDLGPNCFQG